MPRYPRAPAQPGAAPDPQPGSFLYQLLSDKYAAVDESQAEQLLQQQLSARQLATQLAGYLHYTDIEHSWLQQWRLDYYTNGVSELLGWSPAAPAPDSPQQYSAAQLTLALRLLKFALSFYKTADEDAEEEEEEEVPRRPAEDSIHGVLSELTQYPSAQHPLLTGRQLTDIAEYLAKIFGNSFVQMLLQRAVCETPHRMEWKINTPLTLREPSPEPPPPKPQKAGKKPKKSRSPRKKKGKKAPPTPPEDPTKEVGVQSHPRGLLPLRLATTFPMLYQLYTGEEYDEEAAKNRKRAGKKK